MSPFWSLALFASVVACRVTIAWGTYYPQVVYLTDVCGQAMNVQGDVRIKLTRTRFLTPAFSCYMDFLPNSREQLTAKLVAYYMNPAYTSETGNCPYESIRLLDDRGGPILPYYYDYCSKVRPTASFLLGTFGSFSFSAGNYSDLVTPDVDLLLTEVSDKESYPSSTCPSSDFDCGNNYCIFKNLTCNGYDDCGNNQDETRPDCPVSSSLSDALVAGIVVGVVLAIVFVAVIAFLIRRHWLRRSYTQNF